MSSKQSELGEFDTSTPTPNNVEQDHSIQFAIATASKDDVEQREVVRCPECNAPVSSMYLIDGELKLCPECGHRED